MRKLWEKPKLVVLVRGKPEEAVLDACKRVGAPTGNPSALFNNCRKSTSPTTCAAGCYRVSAT